MKQILSLLILTVVTCFVSGQSSQNSTDSGSFADIMSTKVICKQEGKYIGWPSITKTDSGELLVVFSGNREAHVCPFGVTQMIRSSDNGETWSDPETINNTPLDDRDPGILETKNGTLLVNWFTSLAFDKDKYYDRNPTWKLHADKLGNETKKYWIGNWTRRSLNSGQSWEDPVKQVVSAPHGPIEMTDGRLLYVGTAVINGSKMMGVEQSCDDGKSWQYISTMPLNTDDDVAFYHEPHVVEIKNGKLIAMFRYQPRDRDQSYLRQSESYNGGRSWTTSHKISIWGYPPHLIQLNNGWLMVSYGVRREPFGEMACISKDGGETWETDKQIMINPAINSDLGYPASVQLDDGSIMTVYYQIDKKGEKTCLFSTHWRIRESEFEDDNAKVFVGVDHIKEEQRVDILIDDILFTSYLYIDTIPDLKKPVLFPIFSAKGSVVTRGYPLDPRPGERTDHPHQIGLWLNYGDVNNIDFWGNSNAIPDDQRDRMGTVLHKKVAQVKSGKSSGSLKVEMEWVNSDNLTLLKENTSFVFQAGENYRIIDRITTLTAQKGNILFEDTKEGMMAIRVNRALELPSDKPVVLSDVHGNITEVAKLDNTGVNGKYLNSEGIEGLDVWGKQASWVSLSGKIGNEDVSVIIFDHPENPGHTTYWHARGYGLFAANPLGQKTFTKGEKELNLSLDPGESVTFKYRVLIKSGLITSSEISDIYDSFVKE